MRVVSVAVAVVSLPRRAGRGTGRFLDDLRKRVEQALVHGLAQAEVAELHVSIAVEQQVVGLDISVYEVRRVHLDCGARGSECCVGGRGSRI